MRSWLELLYKAPYWFTASAYPVPREPDRLGTVISGVYADTVNDIRMTYFASTHAATVSRIEATKHILSQSQPRDDLGWNGMINQSGGKWLFVNISMLIVQ